LITDKKNFVIAMVESQGAARQVFNLKLKQQSLIISRLYTMNMAASPVGCCRLIHDGVLKSHLK